MRNMSGWTAGTLWVGVICAAAAIFTTLGGSHDPGRDLAAGWHQPWDLGAATLEIRQDRGDELQRQLPPGARERRRP